MILLILQINSSRNLPIGKLNPGEQYCLSSDPVKGVYSRK